VKAAGGILVIPRSKNSLILRMFPINKRISFIWKEIALSPTLGRPGFFPVIPVYRKEALPQGLGTIHILLQEVRRRIITKNALILPP
jgi:hypothetical protein